ncbi:unnamed protein product [Lampetra fluviatilis]
MDAIGPAITDLKVDSAQLTMGRALILQQRLPVLREFMVAGGDWVAFQRHFLAHQEMVGWSDAEVLLVLPAALDDHALAALITILKPERATMHLALRRMSKVYGPPSDINHHFAVRRWTSAESPLAFRRALLAMAMAAYPQMDNEAIDALVLQKLLDLAWELRIVIQTVDDENMCSLRAARSIHLLLHRDSTIAVCASTSVSTCTDDGPSSDKAFMTIRPLGQRSFDRIVTTASRDGFLPARMSPASTVVYGAT